MENLHARAEGLREGRQALGHDHELLEVDGRVGVRAAVDDVHHRHGQHLGVRPAEVLEERLAGGGGGGVGGGERDAEDGVGAELLFVVGAVELDERVVDFDLIERVHAAERGGDGLVDAFDGLFHAFAAVAFLVVVAQLPRLVLAGGRAAGRGGPPAHTAFEGDFDFDGGVAARVEDFQGADVGDGREVRHKEKGIKR